MHLLVGVGQEMQPDSVYSVGQCNRQAFFQSEPHLRSDVVLGQLVPEQIGHHSGGSGTVRSWMVPGTITLSPTDVGAISVVVLPDNGQCLSLHFSGLAVLLVVSL